MKKGHWKIILTQVIYVSVSLAVALILWTVLPNASQPFLNIKGARFGGAFAGFVFTLLFLYRQHQTMSDKQPTSRVSAEVVYPPTEEQRYSDLFKGFTARDYFYAFNAPFQVEQSGVRSPALEVHKKRYRANVKSRYLFFQKESYEDAESFFSELASLIGEQKLEDHVERAYWPNAPEIPNYTFFLGYKGDRCSIVLYPAAVLRGGIPDAVIYIEGAEELHAILQRFFMEQWKKAKKTANAATAE